MEADAAEKDVIATVVISTLELKRKSHPLDYATLPAFICLLEKVSHSIVHSENILSFQWFNLFCSAF